MTQRVRESFGLNQFRACHHTSSPLGQTIAEFKGSIHLSQRILSEIESRSHCVCPPTAKEIGCVVVHPAGVIGPEDHLTIHMGQMVLDFLKGTCGPTQRGYNFVDVRMWWKESSTPPRRCERRMLYPLG